MCTSEDENVLFAGNFYIILLNSDLEHTFFYPYDKVRERESACRLLFSIIILLYKGCDRTLAVLHVNPASVNKTQELQHEATVLSAVSFSQGSKVITGSQDQIIRVSSTQMSQLEWVLNIIVHSF